MEEQFSKEQRDEIEDVIDDAKTYRETVRRVEKHQDMEGEIGTSRISNVSLNDVEDKTEIDLTFTHPNGKEEHRNILVIYNGSFTRKGTKLFEMTDTPKDRIDLLLGSEVPSIFIQNKGWTPVELGSYKQRYIEKMNELGLLKFKPKSQSDYNQGMPNRYILNYYGFTILIGLSIGVISGLQFISDILSSSGIFVYGLPFWIVFCAVMFIQRLRANEI